MNIATGTFGFGTPTECPQCGEKSGQNTDGWYTVISAGWNAKGSELKLFCTRAGCDHKDC
jgi:hypothetical protein